MLPGDGAWFDTSAAREGFTFGRLASTGSEARRTESVPPQRLRPMHWEAFYSGTFGRLRQKGGRSWDGSGLSNSSAQLRRSSSVA